MTRQRVLGTIRYPVFLALWTAGVVAVTAQLQALEAAPATHPGEAFRGTDLSAPAELDPAPDLHDRDAWRAAIADVMHDTKVVSGAWQPRRGQPAPAIEPAVAIVAAESVPTGAAGRQPALAVVDAGPASTDGTTAPSWRTPADADPVEGRTVPERSAFRIDGLQREKAAARTALRAGRFAQAYALLRPAVAGAGRDAEYLGLLALAAVRIGSDGEALVLYRHLVGLEPERGRWRAGLALAQQRLGLEPDGPAAAALAAWREASGIDDGELG